MMLSAGSDLAILLEAMEAFQDQQMKAGKASDGVTLVSYDWAFHEQRTGFDQTKISQLLPQLVAAGWADDYVRHSPKHSGAPVGMRPVDGFAWISPEGRLALSMMRQPPPPIQVALASLGPVAERQLITLLQEAAVHGVSKQDIRRFEELLEEIAASSSPGRLEKAANLVDLLQNSKELTVFFLVAVLPFLRSVVGG